MLSVLLNRMAETVSDLPQEPYSETLVKFEWEKVRFSSYSADDCKSMWSMISRQVCLVVLECLNPRTYCIFCC